MKQLLTVIFKELHLIQSQRLALILILFYPFLVIGALGLAFGQQFSAQKVNVALYIPDSVELGSFNSQELMQIILDTNKANIQLASSPEEAIKFVKTGKSDFALVMRNEKTSSDQVVTDLYLDNSNMIVSGMFSPVAKAAIQLTSFEISSKIISRLWGELLPVRNDLQAELGKTSQYLAEMDEAEKKLDALQEKLSGISISGVQGTLDKQRQNVESTKTVLAQFNSDYAEFKAGLADTNASLSRTGEKLESYHEKIAHQVDLAEQYRDNLFSYEQTLDGVLSNPKLDPAAKAELLLLKNRISGFKQQIDSSIAELKQVKTDIEDSQQMLAATMEKVGIASAKLDSEKKAIDGMNLVLNETITDLGTMNQRLASLKQSIDDVNKLIVDAKAAKLDITGKLKNSQSSLQKFIETLEDLSKINPTFLSRPITVFEKNVYGEIKALGFITPISLALVLLLTCMLLSSVSVITERLEGAHLRMKISPTSPVIFVLGKILGQTVFGFLVSAIILLIAFIGFGTSFQANFPEVILGVLIASFSFISLGLFVTSFSRTQSTAVLSSLIIILPMIFLSGIILPLPLMNQTLQLISSFLPLTAANALLSGLLIKGLSLASLSNQIAILIIPAFALTAYTIKKF